MKGWRVVDKGVNGKPFLWKREGNGAYVMIDIFNPDLKRCYSVLVLQANPLETDDLKGKVLGRGCARGPRDWNGAYERARKIAARYMKNN